MAYCPEDGTEMVCEADSYWVCYSCPKCGTHWEYNGDDPAYRPIATGDSCASCGETVPSDDPADPTVKAVSIDAALRQNPDLKRFIRE